ncbi:hypothetical protein D3C86_1897940 [compost metagenome]
MGDIPVSENLIIGFRLPSRALPDNKPDGESHDRCGGEHPITDHRPDAWKPRQAYGIDESRSQPRKYRQLDSCPGKMASPGLVENHAVIFISLILIAVDIGRDMFRVGREAY